MGPISGRCAGVARLQMGLLRWEVPWSVSNQSNNNNNTFTWSGPSGVRDCTGQRPRVPENQSPTEKLSRTSLKASGLTQSGSVTATRALSTLRGQGAKGSQGCHQEVTPLAGLR
jgi:hypothetical protein